MAGAAVKVRALWRLVAAEQEARGIDLIDALRALEQRLGLRVGTGRIVQRGEIVERAGGVGMLRAEPLLLDGERALAQPLTPPPTPPPPLQPPHAPLHPRPPR